MKNNYPQVSIIVPTYNSEKYIEACINSCITQKTDIEYEIIICDDASTDSTNEIINFLYSKNNLIKIIKNNKNLGVGEARNKAIKSAKGMYIYLLDSDDYIHPSTINILTSSLELRSDIQLVYSDYVYVDDYDQKSSPISGKERPIACSKLIKKSVFARFGLYGNQRIGEEKELNERFKENKVKDLYLPIPLYRYRQHKMTITSNYERSRSYDCS